MTEKRKHASGLVSGNAPLVTFAPGLSANPKAPQKLDGGKGVRVTVEPQPLSLHLRYLPPVSPPSDDPKRGVGRYPEGAASPLSRTWAASLVYSRGIVSIGWRSELSCGGFLEVWRFDKLWIIS